MCHFSQSWGSKNMDKTILTVRLLLIVSLTKVCDSVMSQVNDDKIFVVERDDKVELKCRQLAGETVYWAHNGQTISKGRDLIHSSRSRRIVSPYQFDRNLEITEAKLTDEGEYKCKLRSGEIKEIYQVFIKGHVKIENKSPDVVFAVEYGNVTLWCNATGKPDPIIHWKVVYSDRMGEVVQGMCNVTGKPDPIIHWKVVYSDRMGEVVQDIGIMGPKLEVRNITRHCMASYRCTCTATNVFNERVTVDASFQVNVEFPPEVTVHGRIGAQSTSRTDMTSYLTGSPRNITQLTCTSKASPVGHLRWFKDNILLSTLSGNTLTPSQSIRENSEIFSSYNFTHVTKATMETQFVMTFRLDDLETFGCYMCVAENKHGVANATIFIQSEIQIGHLVSPKRFNACNISK